MITTEEFIYYKYKLNKHDFSNHDSNFFPYTEESSHKPD